MNTMTKSKWLNTEEYPFESHFFKTSVGKMHYVDEGQGEPIIFIHGNPAWSFEFRNLIKRKLSNILKLAKSKLEYSKNASLSLSAITIFLKSPQIIF